MHAGPDAFGHRLDPSGSILDAGNRILTVTVKEDAQVVDKMLTLAKDAKVEGELTEGKRVNVRLSVLDKEVAVGAHVLKDE